MSDETSKPKRNPEWRFYPLRLRKGSSGVVTREHGDATPPGAIVMYRQWGARNPRESRVQYYVSRDEELAILLSHYPKAIIEFPPFLQIRAVLRGAGHTREDLDELTVPEVFALLERKSTATVAVDSDAERPGLDSLHEDSRFSAATLANYYRLPYDALRTRLSRWRNEHFKGDWTEGARSAKREAKYLYRYGSIRHIIKDMREKAERSSSVH